MSSSPTTDLITTPVVGSPPAADGVTLPVVFDAGYPTVFAPDTPGNLGELFPTVVPEIEKIVYQAIRDACSTRTMFPPDGHGIPLPAQFNLPPDIALFKGRDSSYPPVGTTPVAPIPVIAGWPAYPGQVPAIGVAEATSPEDPGEAVMQGGFAGDAFARDENGNVLATCAYYSEPLRVSVVVELIHTNRDERDRLHDQLRRVLYPLRHLVPASNPQVWNLTVAGEKQELPIDEQPLPIYLSLFTVEATGEMLIPTAIVPGGVITRVDTTVTPT